MYLIATSGAEHLVAPLQKKMKGVRVVPVEKAKHGTRYFPDGEVYIRIPRAARLHNKRVVVVHTGSPHPNQGLLELELVLQILRDNAITPDIFFTYFPYGMQDSVFEPGETNVAENLIEKLISYYRVPQLFIIDPHFGGRKWMTRYPLTTVSAVPLLLEKAHRDYPKAEDFVFMSCDKGGKRRTGVAGIRKKRLDAYSVEMFSPSKDLTGKYVGVVDDILETGGTLLRSSDTIKKAGAKKVVALITHGLLPESITTVKKAYTKLYLTNTIAQKEANVDISELIAKTLQERDE